jgi:redox-sensing transcriptional repressor
MGLPKKTKQVKKSEEQEEPNHPSTALGAQPAAAAIRRMSLYLRELQRLEAANVNKISSQQLAETLEVSADVVRHDLSMLGSIGRRGIGYETSTLSTRIREVLGTDTQWRVALVGTGSLGHALLKYHGFERMGFQLVAALDIDPNRIGEKLGGITIGDAKDMSKIFRRLRPQLAILAVPAEAASQVATKIAQTGVSGILNFAPTMLKLPSDVGVINVDLASEMQRLSFLVSQNVRKSLSPKKTKRT